MRMQMTIEKNMENKLPSFIIAQDVKSGYNNVNIKNLLKKFKAALDKHDIMEDEYIGKCGQNRTAEEKINIGDCGQNETAEEKINIGDCGQNEIA